MNYLHIMFFIIAIPLVGMDNDSDHRENEVQKRIHIDIPTQDNEFNVKKKITPETINYIQTVEQLKKVCNSNESFLSEKNLTEIAPTVAATVIHTLMYKKEPSQESGIHKQLKKKFGEIQEKNPDEYNKITKYVLDVDEKLDGDISAKGIQNYKARKQSHPNTPQSSNDVQNSSSESPKRKAVNSLLKAQYSLKKEVEEQEKTLEEIKEESKAMKKIMGQLTLKAAEDAALVAQQRGNRIAIVSALSATLIGTASVLITYYTSSCNATHGINPTNSTQ